jgi:hypothetical protein
MTNFYIRIFKLGLIIFHICYFLGMFWFIFCDLAKEFTEDHFSNLSDEELEYENSDTFI